MSRIEDLQELKEKTERMRQERDKAQGRLEEVEKQLKETFGVKTLKAAEKMLSKLEEDEEKARNEFDKAFQSFNDKWEMR